jgi:uncharacterized protein (TIGR02996 family)
MTTHDEQAFLTAILANPDDDTPRLVFADWLDERGSADDRARAALIRAQCRIERNPPPGELTQLTREIQALLKKHARRWTEHLRAAKLGTDWTFRRGFLDGGALSATLFVERGEELFRLAPTIRALKFTNAANETTELAASPFLARLASVDLTLMCTCGWCPIDGELRDLFKSKHATNLKCLNVSRDRIDEEGAAALARSKVLANLTELDLSRNPLEAAGVEALLHAKHLRKLRVLNLSGTSLQNAGAEVLAGATNFTALTRLDLSSNNIRAGGTVALARSPLFKQLVKIDLSHNRIGEGGATALAGLPEDAKVEVLAVRETGLSDKAAARLKARFGNKVVL